MIIIIIIMGGGGGGGGEVFVSVHNPFIIIHHLSASSCNPENHPINQS